MIRTYLRYLRDACMSHTWAEFMEDDVLGVNLTPKY